MSEAVVLVERHDAVALITLNRPHAMNALSSELRAAFAGTLQDLAADSRIRALVLTGAGDRAFSAGLDLKELGRTEGGTLEAVGSDPSANPILAMQSCPKPIIGAVNGVAVTGGFEVALACDMLICSDNARFADTHVKVEVLPGWGLSQRLQRRIGDGRAKELSFTGRFLDAQTALAWGLVNRVVPSAQLIDEALALAQMIAAHPADMVRRYKELMDDGIALPLGEALALEATRAREFNASIDAAAIEGRREGVRASNRA